MYYIEIFPIESSIDYLAELDPMTEPEQVAEINTLSSRREQQSSRNDIPFGGRLPMTLEDDLSDGRQHSPNSSVSAKPRVVHVRSYNRLLINLLFYDRDA